MRSGRPLRVAIVSCGAVAELVHLPAIASLADVELRVLVDKNPARAARINPDRSNCCAVRATS
jgi:predicted dehydrogenase